MTVVFSNDSITIEVFTGTRASIATGGQTFDFNLSRPARFMGGSVSIDMLETAGLNNVSVKMCKVDDTQLMYGDPISQVRTHIRNGNAGNVTAGPQVVLILGK